MGVVVDGIRKINGDRWHFKRQCSLAVAALLKIESLLQVAQKSSQGFCFFEIINVTVRVIEAKNFVHAFI